jgi:hypothetical protein
VKLLIKKQSLVKLIFARDRLETKQLSTTKIDSTKKISVIRKKLYLYIKLWVKYVFNPTKL